MYSWKPSDVFGLLGISIPSNRTEVKVPCPYCTQNNQRMQFNLIKGVGKCYQCGGTADSARYYATMMHMNQHDARKDIERQLGIEQNSVPVERGPRIVCKPIVYEGSMPADSVLDETYRAFLSEITLSEKNRNMLINRGLDNSTIEALQYRTLPTQEDMNLFDLCRRLQGIDPKTRKRDQNMEPHVLENIPGFFKCKRGQGDFTIAQMTKGIIMPQVNVHNQVTGLQIRKDDDLRIFKEEEKQYESKCGWFSSNGMHSGCKANADVHFACDFSYDARKQRFDPVLLETEGMKGIYLTEGIMKADIAHFCLPTIPFISVPRITYINHLEKTLKYLRDEYGLKLVRPAFDMDYNTSENGIKALTKIKEIIEGLGLTCVKPAEWTTDVIVMKDNEKKNVHLSGIDDFLVFSMFQIYPQLYEI